MHKDKLSNAGNANKLLSYGSINSCQQTRDKAKLLHVL